MPRPQSGSSRRRDPARPVRSGTPAAFEAKDVFVPTRSPPPHRSRVAFSAASGSGPNLHPARPALGASRSDRRLEGVPFGQGRAERQGETTSWTLRGASSRIGAWRSSSAARSGGTRPPSSGDGRGIRSPAPLRSSSASPLTTTTGTPSGTCASASNAGFAAHDPAAGGPSRRSRPGWRGRNRTDRARPPGGADRASPSEAWVTALRTRGPARPETQPRFVAAAPGNALPGTI